jgi:AraC-like DNA-binding protein
MPPPKAEPFSRYIPPSKAFSECGCQVVSCGFEHVGPGVKYPLREHPDDHLFSYRSGRILSSRVIVFATAGQGRFEAENAKPSSLSSGDVFLIFPSVRHRYRPDMETGWSIWWVELSGPTVDKWMRVAEFSPERPVLRQAGHRVLLDSFHDLAAVTREDAPLEPLLVSTAALQIIARTRSASKNSDPVIDRDMAMVHAARQLIRQQMENPTIAWGEIATKIGMGYSSFRHVFSRVTGVSPGQYHLFLRQRHAVSLLQSTGLSVSEISERLGFDSIYYFSRFMKKRTGYSPRELRAGRKMFFPDE